MKTLKLLPSCLQLIILKIWHQTKILKTSVLIVSQPKDRLRSGD